MTDTNLMDRELLCDLFEPKPANRAMIMGGYTDDKVQAILDRIALFRQQTSTPAVMAGKCSCMEVFGEDPACPLHGFAASLVMTDPTDEYGEMDENGDPCWCVEVQVTGGHYLVATIWGGSAEEASRRGQAFIRAQVQP